MCARPPSITALFHSSTDNTSEQPLVQRPELLARLRRVRLQPRVEGAELVERLVGHEQVVAVLDLPRGRVGLACAPPCHARARARRHGQMTSDLRLGGAP